MKQSALSFLAEIDPQQKEKLFAQLETIDHDIEENSIFPFVQMKTIHFARFIVLNEKGNYPPYLAFFSNYDGNLDDHLKEVISESKDGFITIFGACKNFPVGADVQSYIDFIKKHSGYRSFFYRGTWGRSVDQIRKEELARKHAENFLDKDEELRNAPLGYIVQKIKNSLNDASLFKKFPVVQRPRLGIFKIILLAIIVLLLLPLLIPLLILFVVILRVIEESEKRNRDIPVSDYDHTVDLKKQEDKSKLVQNQITHLVDIKKGWFRLLTLRLVLEAIYFLARVYYNKGKLGNISTIHFARWVIIDNGKRLLFTSNFDGSWESYLSDFVDRAAVGLTAVWSNTVGFPKAKFLAFKGAQDEQRFKSWTRNNQIRTQVWYSAYKDLTVKNINNSTAINESLRNVKHDELSDLLNLY